MNQIESNCVDISKILYTQEIIFKKSICTEFFRKSPIFMKRFLHTIFGK